MKKTVSKFEYICNKNNFYICFSYYYQKGLCHLKFMRAEVMPVSHICQNFDFNAWISLSRTERQNLQRRQQVNWVWIRVFWSNLRNVYYLVKIPLNFVVKSKSVEITLLAACYSKNESYELRANKNSRTLVNCRGQHNKSKFSCKKDLQNTQEQTR